MSSYMKSFVVEDYNGTLMGSGQAIYADDGRLVGGTAIDLTGRRLCTSSEGLTPARIFIGVTSWDREDRGQVFGCRIDGTS